jgi:hypothetical protein
MVTGCPVDTAGLDNRPLREGDPLPPLSLEGHMKKEDLTAPRPTEESIARLRSTLHLSTPLIALYDTAPSPDFEPLVEPKDTDCCFSYFARWLNGETLVVRKGGPGCPGGHRGLGLENTSPPFMAHFLTDGVGAPAAEGLRATPEIAQAILDQKRPVANQSGHVLVGPLRADKWDAVRSVTFFASPDHLAAVTTLAGYWSGDKDIVAAPFGSACSSLMSALGEYGEDDHPILGGLDLAMRRHIPDDMLTLSVSPARFAKMLTFPEESFMYKSWWNELARVRQ